MGIRFRPGQLPMIIATGLAALLISLSLTSANNGSATPQPLFRCATSPAWGFDRWHSGQWNWCASDGYGPPEWMYWNYMPGTTGYDNPGIGGWYTEVAASVGAWASAQPNWKFTYKSGDWASGTDLFIHVMNLDSRGGSGMKGVVDPYFCTSSTSCTLLLFGAMEGLFNLLYVYLDTSGITTAIATHEFGHAFGLVHPQFPNCFFTPSVMIYGCAGSPTAADIAAVDWIYPDP